MKPNSIFSRCHRGLLENAGTILGKRTMQWDLAMIEPGLRLRVGPTLQTDSVLEFTMDSVQDRDRFLTEEPSTGTAFDHIFPLCLIAT